MSDSYKPSLSFPFQKPLVDPILRAKRALDYWHKTGRFPFDEPGYDPETGLVHDPSKPKRKHRRTRALEHTSTDHSNTSAQINSPSLTVSYYKKDLPIAPPTDSDEGSDLSTERTPYWLRPMVRAEREERESLGITPKDYGTRWQSAYRTVIGEMPDCGPGDHSQAEDYWTRIRHALQMAEGEAGVVWTPNELNRLHLLEKKWRKRKDGEDPWFEVRGTKRGGLTEEEREQFEEIKAMIDINKRSTSKGML